MISTIIFDMGGVLNTIHIHKFYTEVLGIEDSSTSKHKKPIDERVWGKELTTNKISLDTYFSYVSDEYSIHYSLDDYLKKIQSYIEWNYPLFEFIEKNLKGKFRLVIFSNNSELFICDEIKEELSLIFDGQYYSFELRCKKPQVECYDKLIESIKVKPQECIFIDDVKKNLYPAKNLGMDTILYKSVSNLKKELESRELI